MLQQLSIRNIALIENLTLELGPGFQVISGETGAGKSIMIDALNLVLGERADKELVRTGTDKARVEGVFSVEDDVLSSLLEDAGIENGDGELIIQREFSREGKGLCRINGTAVTLAFLKRVADRLADIHGQHEHQLLLNSENHLHFLDSFGGEQIRRQKESVRCAYRYYKSCEEKLHGDWGTREEREQRADLLAYQCSEIEKAEITPGQEEELTARANVLRNADKIESALLAAKSALADGALDAVRASGSELNGVSGLDGAYAALQERIQNAYYELEDIGEELSGAADRVECDPRELEQVDDRLAQLKRLYRKYGFGEAEVLKYYDDACAELDKLRNAEETIAELERQRDGFRADYDRKATKLSELRAGAAAEFEDRIREELTQLGMKDARLEVHFGEEKVFTPEGCDTVEFLFSANLGEPVRPLSRIISGGEMSRFMLAVKSVAADDAMLPTMVFDEIDTGISGRGAQVVAEKIARLSKKHQVLAVTHLPQLASMADEHFLVAKKTENGKTSTGIRHLEGKDRVREIARLSGGTETALALERAREVLEQAKAFRKTL